MNESGNEAGSVTVGLPALHKAWQAVGKLDHMASNASAAPFEYRKKTVEACEMIRDALQSAKPAWQPIETAPKDETFVLLLRERGDRAVGFWDLHWGAWLSFPGKYQWEATYWMPLPSPPQETP